MWVGCGLLELDERPWHEVEEQKDWKGRSGFKLHNCLLHQVRGWRIEPRVGPWSLWIYCKRLETDVASSRPLHRAFRLRVIPSHTQAASATSSSDPSLLGILFLTYFLSEPPSLFTAHPEPADHNTHLRIQKQHHALLPRKRLHLHTIPILVLDPTDLR